VVGRDTKSAKTIRLEAQAKMIYETTKRRRVTLDAKAIGRRIASARKSRKWTQKDLAEAVGVRPITVCNYECGVRIPPLRTIVTIASHLKRTLEHLLFGLARRADLWKAPLIAHRPLGDAVSPVAGSSPSGDRQAAASEETL